MSALIAEIGGEVSPERNGLTVPDVAVTVEGEKVMAFSTVLALSSPVFAALLGSVMREGRTKEVNLPGKSKGEFELFLSFLQPCSRVRVSPDNVDVMLPWFDEYQVWVLKEECENVLFYMPCTVQRLRQATKFGMEAQYQRCLRELPVRCLQDNFEDLARDSQAIRDVLPRMEEEIPGVVTVAAIVRETLGTPRLEPAMPFFKACVEHGQYLDARLVDMLRESLDPATSARAAAGLFEKLLQEREQSERTKVTRQQLHHLAHELDDHIRQNMTFGSAKAKLLDQVSGIKRRIL